MCLKTKSQKYIGKNMFKRVFLMILFASACAARAMKPDGVFRFAIIAAVSWPERHKYPDFSKLQFIKEDELTNISRGDTPDAQVYHATLTNGDLLSCSTFHAGPMKGKISCTRSVVYNELSNVDCNALFMINHSELPIRSTNLFFVVQKKYEEQMKNSLGK